MNVCMMVASRKWSMPTKVTGVKPDNRHSAASALLDGRLYVFGGTVSDGRCVGDMHGLDLGECTPSPINTINNQCCSIPPFVCLFIDTFFSQPDELNLQANHQRNPHLPCLLVMPFVVEIHL
jgi:hypothetical protein